MISHEAGFPALHMTDHVPFYTTLSCKRLHFPNTLFRIILTENPYTCFHGSLDDLDRLGFRHNHQSNFVRGAVAPARDVCNLVKCGLIVFANGGNEVGHEVIIIFQVPLTPNPSPVGRGESLQRDQGAEATGAAFFGAV